jgi:hypothetical protein
LQKSHDKAALVVNWQHMRKNHITFSVNTALLIAYVNQQYKVLQRLQSHWVAGEVYAKFMVGGWAS